MKSMNLKSCSYIVMKSLIHQVNEINEVNEVNEVNEGNEVNEVVVMKS